MEWQWAIFEIISLNPLNLICQQNVARKLNLASSKVCLHSFSDETLNPRSWLSVVIKNPMALLVKSSWLALWLSLLSTCSWCVVSAYTWLALWLSLLSTCSWCVVSALASLSCGCRRIIQVEVVEERPPHMILKRFGCTTIHNKVLYKCFIHSFKGA